MGQEKRLHPRTIVRLDAEIREGEVGWERAVLRDLSAGGAGVLTHSLLPVQSEVDLRFRLPGEEGQEDTVFEVACLVIRSGPATGPDPDPPILLGLHFLTLNSESFERVRRFVWNRLRPDTPP